MQKKFAEDQARLRAATSEATGGLDRLRHVQAASATPYLVLSGNIKPGQISDPSSGFATSDKAARRCLQTYPVLERCVRVTRHCWIPHLPQSCPANAAHSEHDLCVQVSLTPVLGAQTPALGGGVTPLAGNRKVEAMLGIDRTAADRVAMPPPTARRKQQ